MPSQGHTDNSRWWPGVRWRWIRYSARAVYESDKNQETAGAAVDMCGWMVSPGAVSPLSLSYPALPAPPYFPLGSFSSHSTLFTSQLCIPSLYIDILVTLTIIATQWKHYTSDSALCCIQPRKNRYYWTYWWFEQNAIVVCPLKKLLCTLEFLSVLDICHTSMYTVCPCSNHLVGVVLSRLCLRNGLFSKGWHATWATPVFPLEWQT